MCDSHAQDCGGTGCKPVRCRRAGREAGAARLAGRPARKSRLAHVIVERCAQAICGTIAHPFDATGPGIAMPNDGTRKFRDRRPVAERRDEGRACLPALDRSCAGALLPSGDRLAVKARFGPSA